MKGWLLNAIALLCMIASGAAQPLMNLVFGKFVDVFNDFFTGKLSTVSTEGYRTKVNEFR